MQGLLVSNLVRIQEDLLGDSSSRLELVIISLRVGRTGGCARYIRLLF